MPTINLDKTYLFRGKHYGPGTVEAPEGFPALQSEEEQPKAKSAPIDPLSEYPALVDAGYDTPDKLRAASDEELTAVPGIGKAALKKIRAALE